MRHVVTVHDVAWRRHPEATTARGAKWHEAALCRARDSDAALVVTSKFVAADLLADGVQSDRITIVNGGSDHLVPEDPVQTEALLERLGVRGEFLLTVSTLEPRKNVDRLLQAYGQIRPDLPEPWPLVIVGPTGWGPQPFGAAGPTRRGVRRSRQRRHPHRPLPTCPGLCLRPLDRGLRPSSARGDANRGHRRSSPTRCRAWSISTSPVPTGADRRPLRRRRTSRPDSSAVLTDDTVRADLVVRGAGPRALAHVEEGGTAAHRALERPGMTAPLAPSPSTSPPSPLARAGPGTTPWPSRQGLSCPGRHRLDDGGASRRRGTLEHLELPERRGVVGVGSRLSSGSSRLRTGSLPAACSTTLGVQVHHAPHYTMPARAPVPCVVTIHDCTFFDHPEWHVRSKALFFRRAIRQAAAHAAALICVSEVTATRLRACCDVRAPIVVAPHGVDHARFTPLEPSAGADRALLAGARSSPRPAVGRLRRNVWNPAKGWRSSIAAFDRVADRQKEASPGPRRADRLGSGRDRAGLGPGAPRRPDRPRWATCRTTPCPHSCARPPWSPTRRWRRGSGCPPSRPWPAALR